MENIWQGSKVYQSVTQQHIVHTGKVTWSHPAEIHVLPDGTITDAYFNWSTKLYQNPYPVRYPNGYNGRRSALYSLWYGPNGWQKLPYLEARRVIYCPLYAGLVRKTEAFQKLVEVFRRRRTLSIADVDVPDGMVVTPATYEQYLGDPNISFGHAWTLGKMLMETLQ